MIVDDNVLLAYADNALPPAQRAAVDALLPHNNELREQVRLLQASRLPYQAAFAAQALPPMPQHLQNKIMKMTRASAAPSAPAANATSAGRTQWKMFGGMAAAVLLGIGLHAGSGYLQNSNTSNTGWIAEVASYQRFYVRDTVQFVQADAAASRTAMNDLYQRDHIRVDIPDLSTLGLQFKRVQRLGFGERPLMQMVYLPQQGNPVALCVMPENGADTAPHPLKVNNMNTVAWRRAGLAYVLVADGASDQLAAAGNLLYENKLPSWLPNQQVGMRTGITGKDHA
jgi:anti-sigma factor RsiW